MLLLAIPSVAEGSKARCWIEGPFNTETQRHRGKLCFLCAFASLRWIFLLVPQQFKLFYLSSRAHPRDLKLGVGSKDFSPQRQALFSLCLRVSVVEFLLTAAALLSDYIRPTRKFPCCHFERSREISCHRASIQHRG